MKLANVVNLVTFSLLGLYLVTSCSQIIPTVDNNSENIINISKTPPIQGVVQFPELSLNPSLTKRGTSQNATGYKTKATIADIAVNTTISILYPANHPLTPNKTIATGLTDSNGNFLITPSNDFQPANGEIFVIEASKRLGGSGNNVMSLRTYIRYTGSSWESMTTPGIYINGKTTALAIIEGNNPSITPDNTINKIPLGEPLDVGTITGEKILSVSTLVGSSLVSNHDPFSFIKYQDGNYFLDKNYDTAGYLLDKNLQSFECKGIGIPNPCDLSNTNLNNFDFKGVDLTGAILSGLNMSNKNFNSTTTFLTGTDISRTNLSNKDLRTTILSGANFSNSNLENTHLSPDFIPGGSLKEISTESQKANFSGAYMNGAFLSNSILQYADIKYAYLKGADLRGSQLENSDFSYSDMREANLNNSNVDNAIFTGADLTGAIWKDGRPCIAGSVGHCIFN